MYTRIRKGTEAFYKWYVTWWQTRPSFYKDMEEMK